MSSAAIVRNSTLVLRGAAPALLVAAFATALAAPAVEAQITAPKVAVIDVQRLVTDSIAGKEALAKLKKLQDDKLAEGKAKSDEIDGLRKRLNDARLSLSDDKLAELEKQIEDRITAFRRFQEDAERDFNKSREQAFGDIERRVFPVIEQVGRENGYALMFNKFQSGLLFAEPGADITDQIIQRFDASASGKAN